MSRFGKNTSNFLGGEKKTYLELRTQTLVLVQKDPESEIFGRSLREYFGEIPSSVSPVIIFPRHFGSSSPPETGS